MEMDDAVMAQPKLPYAKCHECPLWEGTMVPPTVPEEYDLIIVGEAPGYEEERYGAPFVGPAGQLFDMISKLLGKDTNRVYKTNAVMCRAGKNRTPEWEELAACAGKRLTEELRLASHSANNNHTVPILSLGKVAEAAIMGYNYSRGTWKYWDGDVPLRNTWHPAYVLRNPVSCKELQTDMEIVFRGVQEQLPMPKVIEPKTPEELRLALAEGDSYADWAFDIETDQVNWFDRPYVGEEKNNILSLGIGWRVDECIVLNAEELYDESGEWRKVVNEACAQHTMIAHNGMFDATFLRNVGMYISVDWDTMLAHYALSEVPPHGLKELAGEYFDMPDYEEKLIKQYLRSKNDLYGKIPREPRNQYMAMDVITTLRLKWLFEKKLGEEGLLEYPFQKVLMRASHMLMKSRIRGFKIDMGHLGKWQMELARRIELLTKKMIEMSGHDGLNPNSWQQLAVILWDEFKLPQNIGTKTYKKTPRSTNEESVQHLSSIDPKTGNVIRAGHPFVDVLMEYRHVAKMLSSYLDNIEEYTDGNQRVHSDILIHGTEIGRLAYRNPALQTIPRDTDEYGHVVKSCFVAAKGHQLVVADYSQAELRVYAALTMDPFLVSVYRDGRDLHSEVAKKIFGDVFTKEQRHICKCFNFAYIYGGSEYSLARDADLPIQVAKKFVVEYDKSMPTAKIWKQRQYKKVLTDGYVQTRFGRKRRFWITNDVNQEDNRKASCHQQVSGGATDLCLLSACELQDMGYTVLLLVHDSIILEVLDARVEQAEKDIRTTMEGMGDRFYPEVPWKVDVEVLQRWSEPPELLKSAEEFTARWESTILV